MYLESKPNPASVVISPADYTVPICEPMKVSDEITCNYLSVYCKDAMDTVHLRIVAAGEILYHEVMCRDLTAGAFDYEQMEANLLNIAEDPAAYVALVEVDHEYEVPRPDGSPTGAVIEFRYGTYVRSHEPICFTGDFFPYLSPSCQLHNSDGPVNTEIHNPNAYAMHFDILELKINEDFVPRTETDPQYYVIDENGNGQSLDLTAQLTEAIQGYINLDNLAEAIPSSVTIEAEPACGVLVKKASTLAE